MLAEIINIALAPFIAFIFSIVLGTYIFMGPKCLRSAPVSGRLHRHLLVKTPAQRIPCTTLTETMAHPRIHFPKKSGGGLGYDLNLAQTHFPGQCQKTRLINRVGHGPVALAGCANWLKSRLSFAAVRTSQCSARLDCRIVRCSAILTRLRGRPPSRTAPEHAGQNAEQERP